LPAEPVTGGSDLESIILIPCGRTKFRISMFPITDRARKAFVSEK